MGICGYSAARAAANDAANKTLYAANAANGGSKEETFETHPPISNSIKEMSPISRIAATAATSDDDIEYEEGEI